MVDLDHGDLHPVEQAERNHQGIPLIGVPPHLLDAGVGQLEGQQRRSDQASAPQAHGDRRPIRLAEQQRTQRRSVDDLNGHCDPRGPCRQRCEVSTG
jgi:hypothetical protein